MLFEFCFTTKRQGETTAMDGIEGEEAMKIYQVIQAYLMVCEETQPYRRMIVTLRPTLLSLAKLPGAKLITQSYRPLIASMKEWFLMSDNHLTYSRDFIGFVQNFIKELEHIVAVNADKIRY